MSKARNLANWLPPLGQPGEVLTKASLQSYDMEWAPGGGGGLPPVVPGADQGKALVVNATDAPEWGSPIDNATQILDGGGYT